MEYTSEVLNRKTGDLEERSIGDWITVTELGERYGVGPRQARHVLAHLELLVPEHAGGSFFRNRLTASAIQQGFGKRIQPRKKSGSKSYPFDVLSPQGQQWVAERWDKAAQELEAIQHDNPLRVGAKARLDAFKSSRKPTLTPQMEVCWLLDHYRDITQADISAILSLPKQTVSRHANLRSKQREDALERRQVILSRMGKYVCIDMETLLTYPQDEPRC